MFKKAISLVIVLTLCICLTPVKAIIPGEDAYTPNADYCELVSEQDIIEGGHIERLHEEETEQNTAVYRNADGTNTMYIFSQDVWYRDANGVKQNYTSEIVESDTQGISYESVQGTKCLTLSTKASNGIRYSENGYAVTMFPSNDRVISGVIMSADTNAEIENTEPIITEEVEETVLVTEPADVEVVTEPAEIEELEAVIETQEAEPTETEEPVQEVTEEITEPEETEIPVEEQPTDIEVIENNTPLSVMEENTIEEEEENLLTFIAPLFEGNAQLKTIDNPENGLTKNAVTYGNTFSNIDYTVVPVLHGFQNQMSVRNANADNKFSFRVYLENVIPGNSQGDNIPLFNAQGEMVMQINAETLCDSNGVFIPGSTIDIAPYGNGYYLVTVTLSEEVLEREDLVYPLITTMATTTIGDDPIYDTCVCSATPSSNYGTSASLTVGQASSESQWRTLVQYHLSSYLATIRPNSIISAVPQFYLHYGISYSATIYPTIPNIVNWNAQTLTWNNIKNIGYGTTRNGAEAPDSFTVTNAAYYGGDGTSFIAACIREFLDTNLTRTLDQTRGIMLMTLEESNDVQYFYSANASSSRPKITVNYCANYTTSAAQHYTNTYNADSSDNLINNYGSSSEQNCLGYAIGVNENIQPDIMGGLTVSVSDMYMKVRNYLLNNRGYTSVRVTDLGTDLNTGEYRIAMRTVGAQSIGNTSSDYHFLRESYNSKWCHKHYDFNAVEVVDTDNPHDATSSAWEYAMADAGNIYYYDSQTVIFAVRK